MKRKIALLLVLVFAVTSCKYGTSEGVKKPFKNLIDVLESQAEADSENLSAKFRLEVAKDIKDLSDDLINKTNRVQSFSKKYYMIESEQNVTDRLNDMKLRINSAINTCKDGSLEIQKLIHSIGKQQYLATKGQLVQAVTEDAIMSEILTLYSLQYIKRAYETCTGLTFHYMNEFSIEKYDERDDILALRKELLGQFFGLTGMIKVISKDSVTVSKRLAELKENNLLSANHLELIQNLASNMKNSTQKLNEFTDKVIQQDLPEDLLAVYEEMQIESDKMFEGKTLLFDPANPDHPIVHLLVILSNLTWGSIQSGIGLGIVLTHAIILTPLSWILSPIFPQYFMPLRGPTIKLSQNDMQIYADVCGFPAIPSKMSMGIWELDFCAGYSFASAHEGGHAKQSALLGPFYLPAAILSYAINGGHGGFIESWADEWYVHSH